MLVGGFPAAREAASVPWIQKIPRQMAVEHVYKSHCFVINEYLEHEVSHGTYLELKISIRAFHCLNITPTALLGCSFVTKQGPKSMFRNKRQNIGYGTDLKLKSSIGAFDCPNITSVSLLGCSFMAGQGPRSFILDPFP